MDQLIVTTSVLALVSSTASVITNLFSLRGNVSRADQIFVSLLKEVKILQEVVEECYNTLEGISESPRHVRETLISCYDAGKDVQAMMERIPLPRHPRGWLSGIFRQWRLYQFSKDRDLEGMVSLFRQRVNLLRDMCSELKTGKQLLEASAAILRLMEITERTSHANQAEFEELRQRMSERPDPRDADDVGRMDYAEPTNDHETMPSGANETQAISRRERQSNLERQLISLAQANYTMDATVIIAGDTTHQDSNRLVYKPAKIKFDTASDVDLVSRKYLLQIGFPMDKLVPISVRDQASVHGINDAIFTPKYAVDLHWSRRGDSRTNIGRFMVVDEAPFDLLLESRRFLDGLRLSSLHLFRPRKRKEVIEKEIQEEKKRIEAAKALEEEAYQREIMARRNMEPGRVDTIKTMAEGPNGDDAV